MKMGNFEFVPQVAPLRFDSELEQLKAAAAADDHVVIAPTHIARKSGEIVGYASVGRVPLVNLWVDSHRVNARDSVYLLNFVENLAADRGAKALILPCSEASPFNFFMDRLGYQRLGKTTLNMKGL